MPKFFFQELTFQGKPWAFLFNTACGVRQELVEKHKISCWLTDLVSEESGEDVNETEIAHDF
jgi:hypothetical protein